MRGIGLLLYARRKEGETLVHTQGSSRSQGDHCASHIGAADVDHSDLRRMGGGMKGPDVGGNHFDPVSVSVKDACTHLIHLFKELLKLLFHIDLVSAHMMAPQKLLCCGACGCCRGRIKQGSGAAAMWKDS